MTVQPPGRDDTPCPLARPKEKPLSYKARENRRRKKAATEKTRRVDGAKIERRYYLTLVRADCACARCGGTLRAGTAQRPGVMVYRHTPRETLCVACAETARL